MVEKIIYEKAPVRYLGEPEKEYEHVAMILISNPKKFNIIEGDMIDPLMTAFKDFNNDKKARACVYSSVGENQGAGASISELLGNSEQIREHYQHGAGLAQTILALNKPVVAAMSGMTYGGSLEITAACDVRLCDKTLSWGLPEENVAGCPAGWGGLELLPRIIGLDRTSIVAHTSFTGQYFNAQQAKEWGFVHAVYEPKDLMKEALELAEKMACAAPLAVAASRETMIQSFYGNNIIEKIAENANKLSRAADSEDTKMACKMFAENDYKTKRKFEGK